MADHTHPTTIEEIRQSFRHIRKAARMILVSQRVMCVVSIVLAVLLFLTVVDFAIRLPFGIRLLQLLAGVVVLSVVVVRWILPATRFHPRLTTLALRMERLEPPMRGLLTSGLELSQQKSDVPVTRSLSRLPCAPLARGRAAARAVSCETLGSVVARQSPFDDRAHTRPSSNPRRGSTREFRDRTSTRIIGIGRVCWHMDTDTAGAVGCAGR